MRALIENWWLLALRGVLALLFAAAAFEMRSSAETFTLREFAMRGTVVLFGVFALIAGACTTAAGTWKWSKGKWWRLLVADGLALGVVGLTLIMPNRFTFRALTHSIVIFAFWIGLMEFAAARSVRRHLPDEWTLAAAGIGSLGFCVAFLFLALEEVGPIFTWLGSYAAFSAIWMLVLALRLRNLRATIHQIAQSASHSS